MRRAFVPALAVGAVVVLLAAAWYCFPGWMAEFGLDVEQVLADARTLARADEAAERVEGRRAAVQARIAAKEEVVRALVEHRMPLRDAAARVKVLLASTAPRYRHAFHKAYAGDTEEERICRHLIVCVRYPLDPADLPRAETEALRLEGELREDLRNGTLARLAAQP